MTSVIAIASNKGGVAKTTTCLSLGGSLAEQGKLVLMVDMDPQAHLTLSLGVKPDSLRRSVSDALLGQSSIVAVSQETSVAGLDLAPASRELVILDKALYKSPRYEYRLQENLEQALHSLYDVILLDCPPNFGTLTLNALTAADLLVVPIQCEYYAIRSLQQTLDMVRLVRRKSNPELRYRLLITMLDIRNRIHRVLLRHVRSRFPTALLETVIQIDTQLRESPAFGLPVVQHAPRTRAAQQYRALAQELIALTQPARHNPPSTTEDPPLTTSRPAISPLAL